MKSKSKLINPPKGEIILYKSPDGGLALDVTLEEETVWLTPMQISELFHKARPTILEHIKNIYEEEELERISTCRKSQQVQNKGNRDKTNNVFLNHFKNN